MYRVVLIDDEAIIVEGLKKLVDWTGFGCEVIASAHDAASGRQAIIDNDPHIVFTDIRMPDQDGLSMLAGLRSEFPELLVTVLTGYRDFSYAQEAVRLGVHRLLLKPSRMDEINEAMSSMAAILRDRQPEDEIADRNSSASSYIVRRALSYIEDNHQTKLSLQEVADHCYVSQWHLSKLLNKHTGKKYYDLLNAARIETAKRLLRDSAKEHLTIADISEAVGYSDTGHFSRSFKKYVGVSANEYRNG